MTRILLAMSLLLALGAAAPVVASPQLELPQAVAKKKKAKHKTGIAWKVAPASALIFLNGKKLGAAGDVEFTKTRPGRHTIKLTKGEDETEMEVKVRKGQIVRLEFEFTE